ncbi:MAG TPA: DUF4251 domain-containing protein [Puia sp.]|nr:DUF4251 domain-containing protein [Puia sp.]
MKSLLFICALACTLTAGAQSPDKTAGVKTLVESQNYTFQAQTALPMRGPARQLTTEFEMQVTKNKVVSALPYFGRAYVAPMNPAQGGMDFTSKQFDYTVTPGKKGGWEVVIKPKDLKNDVKQLYLSISQDGYASLHVISQNEDAISYNGVILSSK